MILKIASFLLVAFAIKVFDLIPFEIRIGDLRYSCSLSVAVLFCLLVLLISFYILNAKNIFRKYIEKLKEKKKKQRIIELNKKIILESLNTVCSNCLKYNIKTNVVDAKNNCGGAGTLVAEMDHQVGADNILFHLLNVICYANVASAIKLDQYINEQLFEVIVYARDLFIKHDYVSVQKSLEYLYNYAKINSSISNCSSVYENLYFCYIQNKEYHKCQSLVDGLFKKGIIDKDQYDQKCGNILKYGTLI